MKINGVEYVPEEIVADYVEIWWDRHSRNWIVQVKTKEGYQVGNAVYVYTKPQAKEIQKELENEYGILKGEKKC